MVLRFGNTWISVKYPESTQHQCRVVDDTFHAGTGVAGDEKKCFTNCLSFRIIRFVHRIGEYIRCIEIRLANRINYTV